MAGFPQLPGQTPSRPLAPALAALRPRPVGLQAKPGEAAARRLPGAGAARRGGLSMRSEQGRLRRKKEAFAVVPAAALGYAVPANVAAALRAVQHLPLGPRRPPAPSGAPLWVSRAERLGPRGPWVTVVWSSGCKVVIQHLTPPPLTPPVPPAWGPDGRTEAARGPEGLLAGRELGPLPGEEGVPRVVRAGGGCDPGSAGVCHKCGGRGARARTVTPARCREPRRAAPLWGESSCE